jgi:hypothetical protein
MFIVHDYLPISVDGIYIVCVVETPLFSNLRINKEFVYESAWIIVYKTVGELSLNPSGKGIC